MNIQFSKKIMCGITNVFGWFGRGSVSKNDFFTRNYIKCPDLYKSHVSNPLLMGVAVKDKFFLPVIAWNIQIYTEKSCMNFTPWDEWRLVGGQFPKKFSVRITLNIQICRKCHVSNPYPMGKGGVMYKTIILENWMKHPEWNVQLCTKNYV